QLIAPGHDEMTSGTYTITNILEKYRKEVNPDLLFVSVDLSGKGVSIIPPQAAHPNDVCITGFSDSILRFIAERGDANQLRYVDNIDRAKRLKPIESKDPPHLSELSRLSDLQDS